MKIQCFVITALCLSLMANRMTQAQEIDKELSNLAKTLATKVKDEGKKKLAVIDFTDLDGNGSQLGKYIAEQLTIDLVMEKNGFSVLDRANLRRVLAEHKLTASGLVDPENAKKLGQFAGVDALILGTIIPKGQQINLTTKVITTDTAEIVIAARAEFQSDDTVQKLSAQAALTEDPVSSSGTSAARAIATQDFGNLRVNVEKLMVLSDGAINVDFSFQNKSTKNAIAIALYHDDCFIRPCQLRTTLIAANGQDFICDESGIKGIGSVQSGPENLTEVEPGATIQASIQFGRVAFFRNATSFRLQSELVVNQNFRASQYANYQITDHHSLPPGCKIHNLVLEIPAH